MIPVRSQWGHYSLPRLMEYKWNLVGIYGDYNYSWENQHIDYRAIVRWSYSDDMEIVHWIVRLSRGNQPFWSNSWIIGMVFIPKIDGDMFLMCSWCVPDMFWSPCTFSQHQITKQSVMPSTFLRWWVLRTPPPSSCHLWVLEDYFPTRKWAILRVYVMWENSE